MALARFQSTEPSGGAIFSSATLRNNYNALHQGDLYPLRVVAQDIPDNTVKVYSSNVEGYYQQVWVNRTTPLNFSEGNSPIIIAPTSNDRITLLTIDGDGVLAWTYGAQSETPAAPNCPIGKLPLAYIYQRTDKSTIYDLSSDNGIDCYIQKDVRPILMPVLYPENIKEILEGYDEDDDDLIGDFELLEIISDWAGSVVSERVVNVAIKVWAEDLLISGLPANLETEFFNIFASNTAGKYNALFYGGEGTKFEEKIDIEGTVRADSYLSSGGSVGLSQVIVIEDNSAVEHTLTFENGLLVGYSAA
ncbi:MAG: hypothetical protein WC775_06460 [Patescibacteria group bacterium]|jgi:hypothetical protein